jgi:hypothetical protein
MITTILTYAAIAVGVAVIAYLFAMSGIAIAMSGKFKQNREIEKRLKEYTYNGR